MARQSNLKTDDCPMARALYIVGDRWSLLIIRDAFDGTRRFNDFRRGLNVAKNILSERLKLLVDEGVLSVEPASDGSPYHEYVLTKKGIELFPIVVAFRQWGEAHLYGKGERHSLLVERKTGKPIRKIELRTQTGVLLDPADALVKKRPKVPTAPRTVAARTRRAAA
jgi:DNA-binding HxlR family transcriptional regulator